MEARSSGLATIFEAVFWLYGSYSRWHHLANRLNEHGGIVRVTHRRQNRDFLLKLAVDRDGYRAKLRNPLGWI